MKDQEMLMGAVFTLLRAEDEYSAAYVACEPDLIPYWRFREMARENLRKTFYRVYVDNRT